MATYAGRIVVAVGGNASYPPNIKGLAEEQFALMVPCASISSASLPWAPTHSHVAMDRLSATSIGMAKTSSELTDANGLCVAHSQGGMGYMLQQSLRNVLREHQFRLSVS